MRCLAAGVTRTSLDAVEVGLHVAGALKRELKLPHSVINGAGLTRPTVRARRAVKPARAAVCRVASLVNLIDTVHLHQPRKSREEQVPEDHVAGKKHER